MSGSAMFGGAGFQGQSIGYVYLHILAKARLCWLEDTDDTPLSVAGETNGPGDDFLITFGAQTPSLEVQAKHGLKAGEALRTAVREIADRMARTRPMPVALVVDPSASRSVRVDIARDLRRLKAGRADMLKEETKALQASLPEPTDVLGLLSVISLDLDDESSGHTKHAIQLLEVVLEEKTQAKAAWDVLVRDGERLCRDRSRRTRSTLVSLLEARNIKVRPPRPEAHLQLDISRDLLNSYRADAALLVIARVERAMSNVESPDTAVQYRIFCQRAVARQHVGDYAVALEFAVKAIDLDPDRVDGLLTASSIALEMGDLSRAKRYSDRAVRAAPRDARAWGLAAQLASLMGDDSPAPPVEIAETNIFRLSQAQTKRLRGEWNQVEKIVRDLFREGERSPDALNLLAVALLEEPGVGSTRLVRLAEADALATEVVDGDLTPDDPRFQHALSIRANARNLLGRGPEADSDLSQLRRLAGDSPEVVGNLAARCLQSNDTSGALAHLRHAAVQKEPGLLLLRAQANLLARNHEAAKQDYDAAASLMGDRPKLEWLVARADVALSLGDFDSVDRLMESVGDRGSTNLAVVLTKARLAFKRNNTDVGIALFRDAAALDTINRPMILVEVANRLRSLDRAAEAADILLDAGGIDLPEVGLREYGMALLAAGRMREARAFVDSLAARGPLSDWAVNIGLEIALKADDADAAIGHLRLIVTTNGSSAIEARLELARLLVEAGRQDEARFEVRAAIQASEISANDRMKAAQILAYLGDGDDALSEAFRAYRLLPDDEHINRALMEISQAVGKDPPPVDVVGPNTHVVLASPDGKITSYTIYPDPPVDARASELLVSAADTMGILGKRVGDRIVRNAGLWNEAIFVVQEVKSALWHVVSDVYKTFEQRFPNQSFMFGFPAPDGAVVGEYSPMIAAVEGNRRHAQQIYQVYREQCFPLGWLATMLRIGIPEVMDCLSFGSDDSQLAVEWAETPERVGGSDAVDRISELVLTRSALVTAERLDILEKVGQTYRLLSPRSLIRDLDAELREAERFAADGRVSVGAGPRGLAWHSLDSQHPALLELAGAANKRVRWCREHVRVVPRPLQFLESQAGPARSIREQIGPGSWDALEIALDRGIPVWADDLGLRRVEVAGQRPRGVSTIALMGPLATKGLIDETARHRCLHTLAICRYGALWPSVEFLLAALGRSQELNREALVRILRTLTVLPNVVLAARMLAETIRGVALASLSDQSCGGAARLGLEAITCRWPRVLAAKSLLEAAGRTLHLLPKELFSVQRACVEFVNG